jgi:hypothetical protein
MNDEFVDDYLGSPLTPYKPVLSAEAQKEHALAEKAKREGKGFTYIADDGCEVTITANGNIFYNASDWW